jgi:hypothetical protein
MLAEPAGSCTFYLSHRAPTSYDASFKLPSVLANFWHVNCSKQGVLMKGTIPFQGIFPQVATPLQYDLL